MDDLRTYQNNTSATQGELPPMAMPPMAMPPIVTPVTEPPAAETPASPMPVTTPVTPPVTTPITTPATQTGTAGTGQTTHTIRRGETLADIARQYGITLDELLALNPTVNPYYYRTGDILTVPSLCPEVSESCCCVGRIYCVKVGDTLESVAAAFGITVDELLAANYVVVQLGLIPGQIICIPYPCGTIDACPGNAMQITVQPGQTLEDILTAYDISYNALVALNPNVDFSNLTTGQLLCIPERGTHGTCLDCTATYTIRAGESLESVAQLLGIPVADLLTMNPTLLPSEFVPGQFICLP